MKKLAIIVPLMLVATLVTGAFGIRQALQIDEPKFDFGYAPQHAKITHRFTLHNSSADSLIITKVVPGCGCTKAPLDRDRLGTGESTEVEIIFSTGSYANLVRKQPRIETSDGPPHQNVTITARVVPRPDSTYPVVIAPYKLDISQFREKTRDRMKFRINNVSDAPLQLSLVDAPSRLFSVTLPEEVAAGGSGQGVVQLTEEGVKGEFEKSFTIEVSDENQTRFTVPVKRQIKNPNAVSKVTTE
jgi:hypothetical protein